MAGLITFGENESWSVATWVFAHVLRQTLPHVPVGHYHLISMMRDEMRDDHQHFLDFANASIREKSDLLAAFTNGLKQTERDGAVAFADPEFYPGFVDRFEDLINLLSAHLQATNDSNTR